MQRRLNRFHAIQKARKHLKGKAQKRAIKSIQHLFYLQVKKALAWRVKKYWILDDWTHILPNERAQRSPLSQKVQVFHQHRLSYQWLWPCRPYKFPNANKKKLTAYNKQKQIGNNRSLKKKKKKRGCKLQKGVVSLKHKYKKT